MQCIIVIIIFFTCCLYCRLCHVFLSENLSVYTCACVGAWGCMCACTWPFNVILVSLLVAEGGVSLDTVRKQHAKEIAGVNFGLTRVVQPGLETVQMSILQSAPLPFQPLPMEDEMTLHHRKDIFGKCVLFVP